MVNPVPLLPSRVAFQESKKVKQADPDIVIFNEEGLSPELILQLQYEEISGKELINISRSDIIDSGDVSYSPITNLSSLRKKYNPNNIISSQKYESLFSRFAIDLIQRGPGQPYFDANGDLVIEIENMLDDEIVEIQVDVTGTIRAGL
jgi:hypothetical protein